MYEPVVELGFLPVFIGFERSPSFLNFVQEFLYVEYNRQVGYLPELL